MADRSHDEAELWKAWDRSGRSATALRPLLASLRPLIQSVVNKYRAADVSIGALEAQVENQLIAALQTYDLRKGGLSTHLNWQLRGVGRFVESHQNFARIPGNRIRDVGNYQRTRQALFDTGGREPTAVEVSRASGITVKNVQRLEKELKPTLLQGLAVDVQGAPLDFGSESYSADRERLEMIYDDLTDAEKQVVDYSLGTHGRAKMTSTTAVARHLGVSAARISNIRAAIAKKLSALKWIR